TSVSIVTGLTNVKVVRICLVGVSTSGTSPLALRIGPSGGVVNTGYLGGSGGVDSAGDVIQAAASTSGFRLGGLFSASSVWHGTITLTLESSSNNTWVANGVLFDTGTTTSVMVSGRVSLSGVLDRISITSDGGSDTFDAGEINISYDR